jgi:hypothetical protein
LASAARGRHVSGIDLSFISAALVRGALYFAFGKDLPRATGDAARVTHPSGRTLVSVARDVRG